MAAENAALKAENEALKAKIVEILAASEKALTATEIISKGALGITNQKATAMLTALTAEGKISRGTGEKRKTVFSIAE